MELLLPILWQSIIWKRSSNSSYANMSILDEKQHRTHLQSHGHNSKALLSQFPWATVEACGLKSTFSPATYPSKQSPLFGYWQEVCDTSHISLNNGSFGRELSISIRNRNDVHAEVIECLSHNSSWHFHWELSNHSIILNKITYPASQLCICRPHIMLYSVDWFTQNCDTGNSQWKTSLRASLCCGTYQILERFHLSFKKISPLTFSWQFFVCFFPRFKLSHRSFLLIHLFLLRKIFMILNPVLTLAKFKLYFQTGDKF